MDAGAMAGVQLEEVTKSFGGAAAVDGVSFRASPGDLLALLGPSGCGKSTTLRLIAGLESASAGTITIADQVVLMRNGRVEQDAPPAELYERPASIFVARFVGTPPMNVLPAALVAGAGGWATAGAPAGRAIDTIAIGLRPEAVRIAQDG